MKKKPAKKGYERWMGEESWCGVRLFLNIVCSLKCQGALVFVITSYTKAHWTLQTSEILFLKLIEVILQQKLLTSILVYFGPCLNTGLQWIVKVKKRFVYKNERVFTLSVNQGFGNRKHVLSLIASMAVWCMFWLCLTLPPVAKCRRGWRTWPGEARPAFKGEWGAEGDTWEVIQEPNSRSCLPLLPLDISATNNKFEEQKLIPHQNPWLVNGNKGFRNTKDFISVA